jgi:hypothetical protein
VALPLVDAEDGRTSLAVGAAVALALLVPDDATLRWLAVGTVEGRVVGPRGWPSEQRASLALHGGTPGHDLPELRPAALGLRSGDVQGPVAFLT